MTMTMNEAEPITNAYHNTADEVRKTYGKHALDVSTALMTPEHHNGHLYHRRSIHHRTVIYYDALPQKQTKATPEQP